ncbi:MAG: hypothetical protein GX050_07955 [Firmicutes bacterium]|nr:hypothetical protein [Bacillota bacterium]
MKAHKRVVLSLLLAFIVGCTIFAVEGEGTLLFSDSFEDNRIGGSPAGWEGAGMSIVDKRRVEIPDGNFAVRLDNKPSENGTIYKIFDNLDRCRLYVSFHQPERFKENLYIDVKTEEGGRIFGLFITGSGNVRIRDGGVQSPNILNLPNNLWHRVMLEWDASTQVWHAYVIGSKSITPITPEGGARFDPAYEGNPPRMILFEIPKREDRKVAYIDQVELYDLSE